MNDFFELVYVEGDILQTMIRLCILIFAFDCLLAFGSAIKSVKGAVS